MPHSPYLMRPHLEDLSEVEETLDLQEQNEEQNISDNYARRTLIDTGRDLLAQIDFLEGKLEDKDRTIERLEVRVRKLEVYVDKLEMQAQARDTEIKTLRAKATRASPAVEVIVEGPKETSRKRARGAA